MAAAAREQKEGAKDEASCAVEAPGLFGFINNSLGEYKVVLGEGNSAQSTD